MHTIRLTVQYDGTNYHGFQIQSGSGLPTVQGELERALCRLCGEDVRIVAAGRTDAGVHALGQVVSFKTGATIPPERFCLALNSVLPVDIRVTESEKAPPDFHARYDATGKTYRYDCDTGRVPSVLTRNYTCFVSEQLDVERIEDAARYFVGTHDFAAFAAAGRSVKTTVRTIHRLQVGMITDNILRFTVEGNGFLYNMVRIIVGTLLEVGKGKMTTEDVIRALQEGRRELAGPTAPPHGLCLVKVHYS